MANKKKQTREERLLKKRLAERKRYERIKKDESLWKEKQEKDKLRYIKRKQEKKQLAISEMTPRQQRIKRKQWRKNFNAYYARKRLQKRTALLLLNSTPPESPEPIHQQEEPVLPSSPSSLAFDRINVQSHDSILGFNTNSNRDTPSFASTSNLSQRRLRYYKDKKINSLQMTISHLKKINERYRKKLQRFHKKNNENVGNNKQNTKETNTKTKNCNKNKRCVMRGVCKSIKEDIVSFLEEDQHSRLCAGKKECIVKYKEKKQKRYLCDSLINLHKKYIKERNIQLSYPTFCRLRPFWILSPDIRSRDTCLCKLHTNVELLLQALKKHGITNLSNSRELLAHMTCDPYNVTCLHRECVACQHKVIPFLEFDNSQYILYWQWVAKVERREIKSTVRITEKIKLRKTPKEVIEELYNLLEEFFIHCGNISGQHQSVKTLKNILQQSQCLVHMDFSENYAVKCNEEIQSYHFGGSRKQISLHTVVIYFRDADTGDLNHQSFCTVSDCVRHDASAVWAHIVPILDFIAEKICPHVETIHFLSDSPSSQYRNKKIFHVISSLQQYQRTLRNITWNYSESGHGKGAPDGIGATVKQAADRAVSCGTDIKNIDDFLNAIKSAIHKVTIKTVSEYDIYEKDLLFPRKINNFPGCMKVHQIVWSFDSQKLAARKLSCIETCCLEEPILCPHGKHLGFYTIDSANIYVKPLAESRAEISMLRKVGINNTETTHKQKQDKPEIDNSINILGENSQKVDKVQGEENKEITSRTQGKMKENEPLNIDIPDRRGKVFDFWDSDDDWEYPQNI